MCRLYGFIATEPTKVECSLVRAQNALLKQSRSDSRGRAHPDGWGVAYYKEELPIVERRVTAAGRDVQFDALAARTHARVVIAHVRTASVGSVSEANTHPFNIGRWVFAHNGTIPEFEEVGIHRCEVCQICHCSVCADEPRSPHKAMVGYRAVVVASEPLTDEPWEEVPEGHLLTVDERLEARFVQIGVTPRQG